MSFSNGCSENLGTKNFIFSLKMAEMHMEIFFRRN